MISCQFIITGRMRKKSVQLRRLPERVADQIVLLRVDTDKRTGTETSPRIVES